MNWNIYKNILIYRYILVILIDTDKSLSFWIESMSFPIIFLKENYNKFTSLPTLWFMC